MNNPMLQNDIGIISQLVDSQIKAQQCSKNPSYNPSSKSPLSRSVNSPQSYFSSVSYKKASNISPSLQIQSKFLQKQDPLQIPQKTYHNTYFANSKQLQINQNTNSTQIRTKPTIIKDPIKQIAILKSKIKEEQFLIDLQNAVHKQLMNILSKKEKSLASFKELDQNKCYEIQQQTQSYLDKAEYYVKEMKKLSDMNDKNCL